MNFKKILSCVLCLSLMFSMAVQAFAAETNTYELVFRNEASYEIVIPASNDIDISTGKATIDIAVTDANLAEGTMVAITASSSNYANDSWNLVNIKDNADKIAYTIGTTDGGDDIINGSSVLSANSTTDTTLYVTVSDISKVGTFSDTITFTSEIVDDMISFSVESEKHPELNTTLVAKRGMTWQEFVNSSYSPDKMIIRDEGVEYPAGYHLYDGILETYHLVTNDTVIEEGKTYYFSIGAVWD